MQFWEDFKKNRSQSTGEVGERIAAVFLRKKGFRIAIANWRNPKDLREEIDLICMDGPVLVFVEVKTRDACAIVGGFSAVDARKRDVLRRACRAYLNEFPHLSRPKFFRFDVVEVRMVKGVGEAEVRHFENVSLFSKDFF